MFVTSDVPRIVHELDPEDHIISEDAVRMRNVKIELSSHRYRPGIRWFAEEMYISGDCAVLGNLKLEIHLISTSRKSAAIGEKGCALVPKLHRIYILCCSKDEVGL